MCVSVQSRTVTWCWFSSAILVQISLLKNWKICVGSPVTISWLVIDFVIRHGYVVGSICGGTPLISMTHKSLCLDEKLLLLLQLWWEKSCRNQFSSWWLNFWFIILLIFNSEEFNVIPKIFITSRLNYWEIRKRKRT